MGSEQRKALEESASGAPVRFAGQPVPVGRSPWAQPPRKLTSQAPPPTAPGVYRTRVTQTPVAVPPTPRESMARDFGGVRQITVANPAPYSGKTATVDGLHGAFRQARSDVVAWDSEGLDGPEFGRERDRLARSYRVLIVDTGGPGAPALDATDQLVVAVDSRAGSARAAEALLADLGVSDQAALARNAVVVISTHGADDADSRASVAGQEVAAATAERFAGRARAVFTVTAADAWLLIAQAVADGL